MNNKRILLNFEYSSLQGMYFMYYAPIYSFAAAFLLSKNLSNSQIGLIVALGNIFGVLAITFLANLADKLGSKGTLKIGMTVAFITFALTLALLFPMLHILIISLIFILAIALQTSLQPLISALSFKLSSDSAHVSFGFARSMGSLSYSLICIILGSAVDSLGTNAIPVSGSIIAALMFFSFLSIYKTGMYYKIFDNTANTKHLSKNGGLFIFIKKNRPFVVLCIGVIALFFSNGILNSFLLQIVKNVGGTGKDLGYIFAFMAFLEIPTLIFFDKINKIFKYESMLRLSAICFTIKIGICTVAKNVTLLYVAHFLQPVAFALFLPAMVHYIDKIMNDEDAVKGQGLFTLAVTVSSILAGMLGGFLLDEFSVFAMNLFSTICGLIGTAIIFLIIALNKSTNN
ncbi:MAG: MFS transporter [Eubacteriales bacterium]